MALLKKKYEYLHEIVHCIVGGFDGSGYLFKNRDAISCSHEQTHRIELVAEFFREIRKIVISIHKQVCKMLYDISHCHFFYCGLSVDIPNHCEERSATRRELASLFLPVDHATRVKKQGLGDSIMLDSRLVKDEQGKGISVHSDEIPSDPLAEPLETDDA